MESRARRGLGVWAHVLAGPLRAKVVGLWEVEDGREVGRERLTGASAGMAGRRRARVGVGAAG